MKKNATIVFVALVVLGFLVYLGGVAKKEKAVEEVAQTSRETAMLCTTDMATEFHIHPILKIVVDGVEQVVPANVGIAVGCMHPLHTHDASGLIHVESPIKKDFTLGDFFYVWGKDFSSSKILDSVVSPTMAVYVSVNGQVVDTFEQTILHDKDEIIISYSKKLP